jgi:uncharacterized protein YjiS (DUF1127 family)
MTTLTNNTATWPDIKGWFKNYIRKSAQQRAYRATVAELSNLTDKELRDIGLTRGDIHSIAMETHYDSRGNF